MDKLKLKWKIFSFLLGFCALLLVILWLLQTVLLTDMYKFIRRGEMERAISKVQANINSEDLDRVFEDLETNYEIIVRKTREFVQPILPKHEERKPQPEAITQAREFALENGETISLTFHAMITPVWATVSTLQLQLYIITAVMILLAVVLATFIAKKISAPIEEINRGAKNLAAGDYVTRFDAHGFLEIRELSNTLTLAATELAAVEGLRRELIANVSHDLRTPLALVYSYAEMMHDFPDEITPQQTKTIMDETMRLTSLVNDMLDISSAQGGKVELNRTSYNLTKSLADTAERIGELLKNEGYVIDFENDGEVFICADETKITQVFYNLLINAINYSGTDKAVSVRQTGNAETLKVEVIDNGEGITSEKIPYIWERYYRGDKNHRRAVMGSGLGLSIVKHIVELHGGSCGVDSKIGSGSSFWFTLPL